MATAGNSCKRESKTPHNRKRSMFNQIASLLEKHEKSGGIRFHDLCAELNAYKPSEKWKVLDTLKQVGFSQLGECSVVDSTPLFPCRVGLPHGDGVDRSPARHGIDYADAVSQDVDET